MWESTLCSKSILGTLLALTLVMMLWNPFYHDILSTVSHCSIEVEIKWFIVNSIDVPRTTTEDLIKLLDIDMFNHTLCEYNNTNMFTTPPTMVIPTHLHCWASLASKLLHVYDNLCYKCEGILCDCSPTDLTIYSSKMMMMYAYYS